MNNTIQKLVNLFRTKSYVSNMGAGKISKWQHCSIEEVKAAKLIYYNSLKPKPSRPVNILIVDIETAPMRAYVWSRWK
jgi:hypothetical protein